MANAKRTRKSKDEKEFEILFPFIDVELGSGQKVVVQQWDIDTGAVLTARVVSLMEKIRGQTGEIELNELIAVARDECMDIVATTIGWTRSELSKRATFEDFLVLLQAVIDTSLIREDGGGVLPKVVDLAGALGHLAGVVRGTSPSQPPSTSSSPTGTPSQN